MMKSGDFLFEPIHPLTGKDARWNAGGEVPWFILRLPIPEAGSWISLAWETSLSDPVSRPVIRFRQRDEQGRESESELLLAAGVFGRHQAIVPVPRGTHLITFSPVDHCGSFGFRLLSARRIAVGAAVIRGLMAQPLVALHALAAGMIGRPRDFRLLLTEAIGARPFSHFSQWFSRQTREPDWHGIDRVEAEAPTRICVIQLGGEDTVARFDDWPENVPVLSRAVPEWNAADEERKRALLGTALSGLDDQELVLFTSAEASVAQRALPALSVAATAHPDAAFFYGDEIIDSKSSPISARWQTGFDPLWTFDALAGSTSIAFRTGVVRAWLAGQPPPRRPVGAALWRPLTVRKFGVELADTRRDLLAWLKLVWVAPLAGPIASNPEIEVIVPTRDRLGLLRACVDSVASTLPAGAKVVVVDNGSIEIETIAYLRDLARRPEFRVIRVEGDFNFSRLCNIGAGSSSARLLVFLNNDTTVMRKDWIARLSALAIQPENGAVGARLLYPSGRVQHAGVVVGLGGYAGHLDLNLPGHSDGHFGRARHTHRLLAVTGACLAVERSKFEAIGGFDELHLPVDLSDIDLCLRLTARGWHTVYAAEAELYHHESATRGRRAAKPRYLAEKAYFSARWAHERRSDPYYHPAMSLLLTRPSLG